jgi:hypothetical protein
MLIASSIKVIFSALERIYDITNVQANQISLHHACAYNHFNVVIQRPPLSLLFSLVSWCRILMPRSPISRGSTSNSLGTVSREMDVVLTPEASMLATVPESLLGNAVSKRSKRRATLSTGDSIERATKLNAARNLDKSFTEGTQHVAPSCLLPSEKILSNILVSNLLIALVTYRSLWIFFLIL